MFLAGERNKGAVLVTALVFLMVLTILGLSTMSSTVLEQRMAGNIRDSFVSFQAAEAALRTGETWIGAQAAEPVADGTASNGVHLLNGVDSDTADATPWWHEKDHAWWTSHGDTPTNTLSGVGEQPRYLVEERAFVKDDLNIGGQSHTNGRQFYRVTAFGTGSSNTARTLLQSTYAKRF